jgi:REP element-mobilizing transposase RayT
VPHRSRPAHAARHPLHVTVRVCRGLPSLRRRRERRVVFGALAAAAERFGMRVVHFSVQSNHLHLIVEAADRRALANGMRGLGVRMARRLNRAWGRRGRVVEHRYHARALYTPREVRHALAYVLANARRHGIALAGLDPCSSAAWFEGWRASGAARGAAAARAGPAFVARARTWLLAVGWRRHGRIATDVVPGEAPPREARRAR